MPSRENPAAAYRFGVFEVDAHRGEVRKQGLRVRVRGRPYDILLILLQSPGDLVSRDDLRARLWAADTFVDFDHGLNTSVNRLREMLGDSADSPRYIETVPRKGYRFIAPVEVTATRAAPVSPVAMPPVAVAELPPAVAVPGASARGIRWLTIVAALAAIVLVIGSLSWWRPWRRSASPAGSMRLLVLPFANLSGDAEQEFFSDGFTEEMIAELGALEPARLGVIARTTAMHYKGTQKAVGEIGAELGVDYVLEGSVRRDADRIRITAQLVETKTQTNLWSDSYDRKASDVIGIQKDVAMAIARSLTPTLGSRGALSSGSAPASFSAYEFTLRGRFFREQATEASTRKAIEYFERAIAVDPRYAPAHAGLGDAYRLLGAPGWEVAAPEGLLVKARDATQHALELDPSSPDAHAVMGMIHFTYDWDLAAAEREVREAIRLNPSSSKAHQYYSGILTAAARMDEATAEAHQGMELDPLSATAGTTLGVRLYYSGKIDEAAEEFRKTLEVNPSFAVAHWGLAQCYRVKGRMNEQLDELMTAVALSGNSAYMRAHLGYGYAVAGDRAHAEAIARELEAEGPRRYVAPYHLALIAAGLGDTAVSIRWLERAKHDRSGWMLFLAVEPEFATLKQAPELQRLLASLTPRS